MNQKVGLAVPGEPRNGATDPGRTFSRGGLERRFVGALGQTRPTDALVHDAYAHQKGCGGFP